MAIWQVEFNFYFTPCREALLAVISSIVEIVLPPLISANSQGLNLFFQIEIFQRGIHVAIFCLK